ncbi:hypothetical protein [Mycolicibacterium gilvum]|uniref:hypothetical protein n=1 Tax=Mycolicibacterium gilvum TaxID=1804 RepID=UPI004045247A
MKLGIDVDKQVAQAITPFLTRLDTMQATLEAILGELRARKCTPSGMDEFAAETTHWRPDGE